MHTCKTNKHVNNFKVYEPGKKKIGQYWLVYFLLHPIDLVY